MDSFSISTQPMNFSSQFAVASATEFAKFIAHRINQFVASNFNSLAVMLDACLIEKMVIKVAEFRFFGRSSRFPAIAGFENRFQFRISSHQKPLEESLVSVWRAFFRATVARFAGVLLRWLRCLP